MSGKSSIFSPASQPLFEGQVVRNPTRVALPPGGGGGVSDFPFQFSWPGIVNYTDVSGNIPTITDLDLIEIHWTWATNPIGTAPNIDFFINGVFFDGFTASSGGGSVPLIAASIVGGDNVAFAVNSIGSGNGRGLWIGIHATPAA